MAIKLAVVALVVGAIILATMLLIGRRTTSSQAGGWQVEVSKSQRRLVLYQGRTPCRTYRIGLGRHPVGLKAHEGDGRTPEGDYYVCSKNPQSKFHLSLGLSYPNTQDAQRSLQAKRISQAQYEQISRAIKRQDKPPWDTPLGGEIFIHGSGSGADWTLGCIALDDKDIAELYRLVPLHTPVVIKP